MPNVSNIQYNGTTYGIEGVTDATLTISGRAADAEATGLGLAQIRSDFDSIESGIKRYVSTAIIGMSETFTISASGYGIFEAPLVYGYSYTWTNLTNAAQTLNLYRADGTSKSISSSVSANGSVIFAPDEDDYVQIGGWFNGTGTATLECTGILPDIDSKAQQNYVDAALNGVDEVFTVTSGAHIFNVGLVKGSKYTYTNLTDNSQTLNLYRKDGTNKSISANLSANGTVTFIPDEDDYIAIGGWYNGSGTGKLESSGVYDLQSNDKSNKAEVIFDNNGKASINTSARTVSWAGKIQIHTVGGRYQIEPYDVADQLPNFAVYDSGSNSVTITLPYENTLVFSVSGEILKVINRNNVAGDDVILFAEYYQNDYGLLWDKYWRDLYAVDKSNGLLTANGVFNGEPFTGSYDYNTPVTAYGALFKGRSNVESFAFFTDPHVLGFGDDNRNETRLHNYVKRVQKTYNSTPCSFLICGGDWLNNSTTINEACYRLGLLKGFSKHMLDGCYQVIGNHDTNYQGKEDASSENYTGTLDNETIAAILFRDTDTKKAYYSFNSDIAKCYVLDTGLEHNTMTAYDWEQVDWLAGRLAEDDAEHSIIFLHIIYESGSVQTNASNFGSVVQAYNDRSSLTLNGKTYNFGSCTGHVDFWVAGHTHSDQTGTLGGIPFIITATNGYNSDVPLIDLFLVDYDASKIFTVRVGGTGSNRNIDF